MFKPAIIERVIKNGVYLKPEEFWMPYTYWNRIRYDTEQDCFWLLPFNSANANIKLVWEDYEKTWWIAEEGRKHE